MLRDVLSEDPKQDRRTAGWLFLLFSCFYILCTGGTVDAPDGAVMFRLTESLVEKQSLAIDPLPMWPSFGGQWVPSGTAGEKKFYPKYGPALSVLGVPGYLVGRTLAPFAREGEKRVFEARLYPDLLDTGKYPEFSFPGVRRFRAVWYDETAKNFPQAIAAFGTNLTNSFVVAATLTLLFLIARNMGLIRRHAVAFTTVAGLATPLWAYSKTFFSEPLGALGLTGFLYFAKTGNEKESPATAWALAGLAVGIGFLAKPAHVVLVLPAGILLLLYSWNRGLKSSLSGLLAFSGAVLSSAGIFLGYNLIRFGAFLETGYGSEANRFTGSMTDGVLGLLFSPGRGLAIYAPVLALSVAGFLQFWKKHREESVFVAASLLTLLGLYGRWYGWDGGWCWGPRFLLPVLPVLLLPALPVLFPLPGRLLARGTVLATVVLSTGVALSGTLVHFVDFGQWQKLTWITHKREFNAEGITDFLPVVRWDPVYSAVLRYWDFPVSDYYLLPKSILDPGVLTVFFAGVLALFAVGIVRLGQSWGGPAESKGPE
jgi:hypothetical protein